MAWDKNKNNLPPKDHLQLFVDKFIEKFDDSNQKGEFKKGWGVPASGMPKNAFSEIQYKGMNAFNLMLSGFSDDRWASHLQIQKHNKENDTKYFIRKGETGTPIFGWVPKIIGGKEAKQQDGKEISKDIPSEEGKPPTVMVLKYLTTLFNASQIENFPVKEIVLKSEFEENKLLEKVHIAMSEIENVKIIFHHEDSAFYSPKSDSIHMCNRESFHSATDFYRTLIHEEVHATGAESRLDRESLRDYFSDIKVRAREELVAETGSYLLCASLGVSYNPQTDTNHREYVRNWLTILKSDDGKKELIDAFRKANKAVEFITGTVQEYELKLEQKQELQIKLQSSIESTRANRTVHQKKQCIELEM